MSLRQLVIGPVMLERHGRTSTSGEIIKRVLQGRDPAMPRMPLNLVDVRDVARCHLAAMELERGAVVGRRFISHAENLTLPEVAALLRSKFESQGFRPSLWTAPYLAVWLLSFCDPKLKAALAAIRTEKVFANGAARGTLLAGDAFVEARVSLVDMAESLIALECV